MKKRKKSALARMVSPQYKAADGGDVPDDKDEGDYADLDYVEGKDSDPGEDGISEGAGEDKEAAAPDFDTSDLELPDNPDTNPLYKSQDDSKLYINDKTPTQHDFDDEKIAAAQDYLSKKYAAAADPAGVNAAAANAAHMNTVANVGDALESLAKSNSMAHGGAGVDSAFYQGIKNQGQQGVQQAMAQRQQNIQSFVQQNDINRQVATDLMQRGTYEQQQKAAKYLNDSEDPTSQVSKNAQTAFTAAFKGMPGVDGMDVSKFSASDLANASKNVDVVARLNEMKQMKELQLQYQQGVIQDRHDQTQKQNAVKDLGSLGKDLDTQTATSRTAIGQAQTKVNGAQRLMTFADVTPDDLDQAKNDPAARAALTKKLNNLTPQQYTEVVSGLMSQISNGGGSFGQLEHMRANSADQTMANVQQFFTSHPAPANVGGLIYNNLMTLKNESDTSQAVLDKHTALMESKHPLAFGHDDTKADAQRMLASFANQNQPQSLGAAGPPSPASPQQPSPGAMMAQELPADPSQLVPGRIYKRKDGAVGKFDGRQFLPLQPQSAAAMNGTP